MKVIQHQDLSGSGKVVYPPVAKTGELVFPMPTWEYRECKNTHDCSGNGVCQVDGQCVCTGEYIGAACDRLPEAARGFECPSGYYQITPSQPPSIPPVCAACQVGKFAAAPASTACTLCAPGYYGPETGLPRCLACQEGISVKYGQVCCNE